MRNVMSVDLEDYYCDLPFSEWGRHEDRVEESTGELLAMFDRHDVKATFFVVGYIAEKFPSLIRDIQGRGHEIGTHSYAHIDLRRVTKKEFEEDLKKSIDIIAGITNDRVLGFRAPFFSVTEDRGWIFDVLREHVAYDSSVFPARAGLYGIPAAPAGIYNPSRGSIIRADESEGFVELPPLTLRFLNMNIPAGGGFYFRFFPYFITRHAIRRFNDRDRPAIFYLHPKDLDAGMPKIRQYGWHYYHGKRNVRQKFERLLSEFEFTSARNILGI